jgi:hypothetical protein
VKTQVDGILTAIKKQQNEEENRLAFEGFMTKLTTANTMMVSKVLSEAGDANTSPALTHDRIVFEAIPGLPESIGGVKAQRDMFIAEARRQSQIDINNVNADDADNMNRWTRYTRGMANSGVDDEEVKNRLLSIDFNTTDKGVAQGASQKNLHAAQTYAILHSINPNYAKSLVSGNEKARKFYDSVMVQLQTPGAVASDQVVLNATNKASVDPGTLATPSDTEWKAIQKAAPGLTPSLMQYAVKTYKEQQGQGGAMDYAVSQATGRGVQLFPSWAGWFNPLVPFTRSNNSDTRPYVELGTLETIDPSAKDSIRQAMESLLEDRSKEINKIDPTLKIEPDGLRLNYAGLGTWTVQGIPAGAFNEKYADRWFITDAQVRERMGKLESKPNAPTLDALNKQLAATDAELRDIIAKNKSNRTLESDSMVLYLQEQRRNLAGRIEVRNLIDKNNGAKKNP